MHTALCTAEDEVMKQRSKDIFPSTERARNIDVVLVIKISNRPFLSASQGVRASERVGVFCSNHNFPVQGVLFLLMKICETTLPPNAVDEKDTDERTEHGNIMFFSFFNLRCSSALLLLLLVRSNPLLNKVQSTEYICEVHFCSPLLLNGTVNSSFCTR